jgi:hypothetical protein
MNFDSEEHPRSVTRTPARITNAANKKERTAQAQQNRLSNKELIKERVQELNFRAGVSPSPLSLCLFSESNHYDPPSSECSC